MAKNNMISKSGGRSMIAYMYIWISVANIYSLFNIMYCFNGELHPISLGDDKKNIANSRVLVFIFRKSWSISFTLLHVLIRRVTDCFNLFQGKTKRILRLNQ